VILSIGDRFRAFDEVAKQNSDQGLGLKQPENVSHFLMAKRIAAFMHRSCKESGCLLLLVDTEGAVTCCVPAKIYSKYVY